MSEEQQEREMNETPQKTERRTIDKLHLENFTAFKNLTMEFSPGINAIIGENATGKTHLMKLLYSICTYRNKPSDIQGSEIFIWHVENHFHTAPINKHPLVNFNADPRTLRIKLEISSGECFSAEMTDISDDESLGYTHDKPKQLSDIPIDASFIPAKEMLSHSRGFASNWKELHLPFEKYYYDLAVKFERYKRREVSTSILEVSRLIENQIGGTAEESGGNFYLVDSNNGNRLNVAMVAEGWRKLMQLWILLRTGSITPGTALFWDEPEANMNPKLVRNVVEIILLLQRMGIQIFIATHDYVVLKWLDLLAKDDDQVIYHALYRDDDGEIQCESHTDLVGIQNNSILDTYSDLYNSEIERTARRIEGDK